MPSLAWGPMQLPGLDSVDYSDIGRSSLAETPRAWSRCSQILPNS